MKQPVYKNMGVMYFTWHQKNPKPTQPQPNKILSPEGVYDTAWGHKCVVPFSAFPIILRASYNILEQTAGY